VVVDERLADEFRFPWCRPMTLTERNAIERWAGIMIDPVGIYLGLILVGLVSVAERAIRPLLRSDKRAELLASCQQVGRWLRQLVDRNDEITARSETIADHRGCRRHAHSRHSRIDFCLGQERQDCLSSANRVALLAGEASGAGQDECSSRLP